LLAFARHPCLALSVVALLLVFRARWMAFYCSLLQLLPRSRFSSLSVRAHSLLRKTLVSSYLGGLALVRVLLLSPSPGTLDAFRFARESISNQPLTLLFLLRNLDAFLLVRGLIAILSRGLLILGQWVAERAHLERTVYGLRLTRFRYRGAGDFDGCFRG
jgi:hypothetical protein